MPPYARTRIRIRRVPVRQTHPRRMFEGLLSLVVIGVAFEWTQGSEPEPEPWYAARPATETAEHWAFGIRTTEAPLLRADAWHLPLDSDPADPVTVCSNAVAELWAGTAADPVASRAHGEAVCALPLPGRWTAAPTATDVPSIRSVDVLAKAAPAGRPLTPIVPASRTSPHSATAALTGGSATDWHVGTSRPTDLIASVGDDR